MKLIALALIAGLCAAAPDLTKVPKSAAAASTRHTPQELWLAKQATGNFACRVDGLKVSTESPGENNWVGPEDLKQAFAQVATLEWAHVLQSSFSAMDGRNEEKVLATPGGDMGEFITAVLAYNKVAGTPLSAEDIEVAFQRYIKVMSREKFFYETDERSYTRLKLAAGCRNLHIAEMGGMKRKKEAVIANLVVPEHIGDPYLRFMVNNATQLDVNVDVVHAALTAYHKTLWSQPSEAAEKLCYLMTKGPHREAALVNVEVPQFCVDQGLAPMISQQLACPSPVFLNFPQSVKLLRRELVAVLTTGNDNVDARDVLATYNMLAETILEKFWSTVGKGLPVFTVEFTNSSPILGPGRGNSTSL